MSRDLLRVLAANLPAHAAPRAPALFVRVLQRALLDAADPADHHPETDGALTLKAHARGFLLDPGGGGRFLRAIGLEHRWLVEQLRSAYAWAAATAVVDPPKPKARRQTLTLPSRAAPRR
jgi:hypothetical protein